MQEWSTICNIQALVGATRKRTLSSGVVRIILEYLLVWFISFLSVSFVRCISLFLVEPSSDQFTNIRFQDGSTSPSLRASFSGFNISSSGDT